MKCVDQTKFTAKTGNCFAACVASLLELELHEVPDFIHKHADNWWDAFQVWLMQRDLFAFAADLGVGKIKCWPWPPNALAVAIGPSVSHKGNHAVIVQVRDKTLFFVHDPNPKRAFFGKKPPASFIFIGRRISSSYGVVCDNAAELNRQFDEGLPVETRHL